MRILIATIGSLGDLHPYLALAAGLRDRGHAPIIATHAMYRDRVEALGLPFALLGPDMEPDPALYAKILDPRKGAEFTFRDLLMPAVVSTYVELRQIITATHADLLINSPAVFAAPLIAEKLRIPWVSTVLAPAGFFSAYEPPALPGAPAALTRGPKFLIPWWGRAWRSLGRKATRSWTRPVKDLRRSLGLPTSAQPLYEGQHSPALVLAMFSKVLGGPQPDWPAQAQQTGFCFYDAHQPLDPALVHFLDDGPPPIVFTLGSTAVNAAGTFYEESLEAARLLNRRALLLVGNNPVTPGPGVFAYAPYSAVFPRAAAIVHQGGVGTTAQALRSGVPSLIVPFNFDQPDNAARAADRGVARVLSRKKYKAQRAARELSALLDGDAVTRAAHSIGRQLAQENGVKAACEALFGSVAC